VSYGYIAFSGSRLFSKTHYLGSKAGEDESESLRRHEEFEDVRKGGDYQALLKKYPPMDSGCNGGQVPSQHSLTTANQFEYFFQWDAEK
jgi:hypothetical protein